MQLAAFLRNVGNLRHTTWHHIQKILPFKHRWVFVIIRWRHTSLSHRYKITRFLEGSMFWNVTPCRPLKVNWRFGEICRFHLQGRPLISTCFTLIYCLAYNLTLKMNAKYSSEMSVEFQQTTWRYIPEDRTLHNHRCENLKSYIIRFYCQQTVQTKIWSNIQGCSSVRLTTASKICRQGRFSQPALFTLQPRCPMKTSLPPNQIFFVFFYLSY
jgi:hypothetical protein